MITYGFFSPHMVFISKEELMGICFHISIFMPKMEIQQEVGSL